MFFRRLFLSIGAAALLAAVLLGCWAGWRQTRLASRMIRLHVVANSDTEEDQQLKLIVRDALLDECRSALSAAADSSQAVETLSHSLPRFAQLGAATVQRCGYTYPVKVKLEYTDFPKTDYEGFSLPAGSYRALQVEIGKAEGHNWWCVIFPSLCLSGAKEVSQTAMASGLSQDDVELITQREPKYEIRFRCVELWEEFLQRVRRNGETP